MRNYIIGVFFISFFISITSLAQHQLTGKITSSKNGEAVSGVNVFIPELQQGVVSNSAGDYKFSSLPGVKIRLSFSCAGYKSHITEVQLLDNSTTLNIQLEPSNIELGEVVVLGNMVNEKEKEPFKIETLSGETMWKDGFVTLQNSLANLPGISELSNGLSVSKPVIRGLFGYRIAAIVDGLRFDNQEWQNEHGFGVDNVGIGGVEIVEGPAALLYGSNMIGGAVKFENDQFAPVGETIGEINTEIFSNTLGANLGISAKASGQKLRWQLHLGAESHADYLAGNERKIPNTRFGGFSGKGTLNYNDDWGFSNLDYTFSYHLYGVVEEAELNNPKDLTEDHFEREFEGPHHEISFHLISLRNMFYTGNSKIKFNLGFQNNHRVEVEGADDPNAGNDMGELDLFLNTISYTGEWIYPLFDMAELTIGSQGQFQSNENEGGRFLVPNASMNELSGYAYLKKNFSKFLLEGGIRYDYNTIKTDEHGTAGTEAYMKTLDKNYGTLNGAIGASFSATENLIFKLNFATGFRAPNLAELSSNGVHEGTTRYEIGNPDMKSESNNQVDLGVTFVTDVFKISLTAFNNHVKDFIYLMPTVDSIDINRVYRFKQSDADLRGGEASVDIKPSEWLDITASYSTVIGKRTDKSYLPFMPADKIIIASTFGLPELSLFYNNSFYIGLRNYLKQDRPAENETGTAGYTLLDAGISGSVHIGGMPFSIAVNATNILDKVYINHLSLLKPLGVQDMGRNISLSINVPFVF